MKEFKEGFIFDIDPSYFESYEYGGTSLIFARDKDHAFKIASKEFGSAFKLEKEYYDGYLGGRDYIDGAVEKANHKKQIKKNKELLSSLLDNQKPIEAKLKTSYGFLAYYIA